MSYIGFLSDYGLRDEFVGVCHGVIARRCAQARVIDITHEIARHDVRAGALTLAAALPFLPAGVALAVVDPGVGGTRRALALRTNDEQRLLVGPDNGLLMPAAQRFGGVQQAVDIGASRERLQPLSSTFHGRDLFAPVAAALADGAELSVLGEPLDAGELVELVLPRAQRTDAGLVAHVVRSDAFGNLSLDATTAQLAELGIAHGDAVTVRTAGGEQHASGGEQRASGGERDAAGGEQRAYYVDAFADVRAGALLLYEDAQRTLALAVNLGSAAELLGAASGEELLLGAANEPQRSSTNETERGSA